MEIQCKNCGAENSLPAGKNKMFCAYCGKLIEVAGAVDAKKKLLDKINITTTHTLEHRTGVRKKYLGEYGLNTDTSLELIDRDIESLYEITSQFSDNQLKEVKTLNLSDNQITSLAGLSRFTNATSCNFNNNNITEIDDLPQFDKFRKGHLYLFLENNQVKEITDKTANIFNKRVINKSKDSFLNGSFTYFIFLNGNSFNVDSLSKIRYREICGEDGSFSLDGVKATDSLVKIGFKNFRKNDGSWWIKWEAKNENKNCFIATATLGSEEHPIVIELRNFRDEWILTKGWGKSFVNWYYYYGAIAATVIEKNQVLKKMCLAFIIKPLVYLSRILKK